MQLTIRYFVQQNILISEQVSKARRSAKNFGKLLRNEITSCGTQCNNSSRTTLRDGGSKFEADEEFCTCLLDAFRWFTHSYRTAITCATTRRNERGIAYRFPGSLTPFIHFTAYLVRLYLYFSRNPGEGRLTGGVSTVVSFVSKGDLFHHCVYRWDHLFPFLNPFFFLPGLWHHPWPHRHDDFLRGVYIKCHCIAWFEGWVQI